MAPQIQFTGYNKLVEMAEQVFDDLDAKDGKKDGKISIQDWTFAQQALEYIGAGAKDEQEKVIAEHFKKLYNLGYENLK